MHSNLGINPDKNCNKSLFNSETEYLEHLLKLSNQLFSKRKELEGIAKEKDFNFHDEEAMVNEIIGLIVELRGFMEQYLLHYDVIKTFYEAIPVLKTKQFTNRLWLFLDSLYHGIALDSFYHGIYGITNNYHNKPLYKEFRTKSIYPAKERYQADMSDKIELALFHLRNMYGKIEKLLVN